LATPKPTIASTAIILLDIVAFALAVVVDTSFVASPCKGSNNLQCVMNAHHEPQLE
jgi:hypothetical protein